MGNWQCIPPFHHFFLMVLLSFLISSSYSLIAGGHILEPSMNLLKCPAPELNGLVWSPVESVFLERSGHASMYSNEKIPTVEVLNIYELGTVCTTEFVFNVFWFICLTVEKFCCNAGV